MGTPGLADIDPDERRISHQLAVLIAEQDAAAAWTQTIGRLVTQNLPADEFTAARLDALRAWRRGLGRTHSRLNWMFDERRNPKHVARDIRRTQAQTRARIAARDQHQAGA